MTKKYSTKQALISSVLVLVLCCSMLVGTTFAWFTDSVTSSGNIIKSGNLDVEMYWADGTKAVPQDDSSDWKNAATGAIFNYDKWEPGYVQVRHIKIANEGDLALKYKVSIVANGEVSDLAEVIDVYYVDPALQIADRTALTDENKLGTLDAVLANLGNTGSGTLVAGAADTITLAFKMQETAGNEYMDKSIGTDFSVQLLATQLTNESDSFGDDYDNGAVYFENVSPAVKVPATATESQTLTTEGENAIEVEVPANVLNNIPDEVTSISLGHSEIVYNTDTNTVVIDSVEIVDQNGQIVDLTDNTTPLTVSFEVPFADGTVIDVYHDDELVCAAVIVEGGKITYEALHFCTVKLQNSTTLGAANAAELAEAVKNIEDGGSIILTDDIVFGENYSVDNGGWIDGLYYEGDKSFTIDLNGKTVTNDSKIDDYVFNFKNVGEKANVITFKNGTIVATSSAYCTISTATTSTQKITLNLENVDLIGNNSGGAVIKARGGAELNVMAGTTITGTDSYVCIETVNATTNVYDGAELYQNGTTSYCGSLIGVSNNGTANVYGGYGTSAKGCFIAMTSGGTINVYGGEWTANGDGTYANGNASVLIAQSDKRASSIINVYGGKFLGGYNCYGNVAGDAQINIFEGEFNSNPETYVSKDAKSYEIGGKYLVFPSDVVVVTTVEELKAAITGATDGTKIYIVTDITVTDKWDNRYGGKTAASVYIDGCGNTIKVTGEVNDGFNYHSIFRFEGAATVKNLTFDLSEVTGTGTWLRAISSASDLTVDNCTFIGSDNYSKDNAIVIGDTNSTAQINATATITGCTFTNWRRGISDNENAKEIKTVVISGNTFEASYVYVSAYESITFTDNVMTASLISITSYTNSANVTVLATGNTLDADYADYNVIGSASKKFSAENVTAQSDITVNV